MRIFPEADPRKKEKEACHKSREKRISHFGKEEGQKGYRRASCHGNKNPAFFQTVRKENRQSERKKDASSSERHGEIIPEKNFRSSVHDRKGKGENHDGKDGHPCDEERFFIIFHGNEIRKNIF